MGVELRHKRGEMEQGQESVTITKEQSLRESEEVTRKSEGKHNQDK